MHIITNHVTLLNACLKMYNESVAVHNKTEKKGESFF